MWPTLHDRHFSFSKSGALAFVADDVTLNRTPVWRSRDGQEQALELSPRPYATVQISPDGTRVVLGVIETGGNADIWIHDLTERTTSRFTFDAAADLIPIWTPDGERIVFASDRDGGGLFWKRSDGTGAVERLVSASTGPMFPHGVSPDGKQVVFNVQHSAGSYDIKTVTLDDEHIVESLLETRFDERRATLSPNGRWMAYQSDESGESNIFVRPFPDVDGGRWQVSPDGGTNPIWARDGTELFYSKRPAVMRVAVVTETTFSASVPELVFEGPYALSTRGYDVAPDGERFLMLKLNTDAKREIHVVLNWFDELERLVPTDN